MRRLFLLLALAALAAACSSGGTDAKTSVRFVNASPDADSLNVFIEGSARFPLVRTGTATDYDADVTADVGLVRVVSVAPAVELLRFSVDFIPDARQTLVAAGPRARIRAIVLRDSVFTAGQPHVRLVQAAALADTVDVLFYPDGALPFDPTFPAFAFRQNTGYVPFAAGTYRLQVRASDGSALLDQLVALAGNAAQTLVLADATASGGMVLIQVDG